MIENKDEKISIANEKIINENDLNEKFNQS